jgi:N-acyl-L-homoserine lactone synthetase
MAILIEASQREAASDLLNASYELRHRILVRRLGWKLPSGESPREVDAFDSGDTCHLVSRTQDGRVRGTMRLTPSLAPNVTCDVLQSSVPVQIPRAAHIVECSRLCVDLDMPSADRFAARADLFLSQLEMCDRFGWTHTVGVLMYFVRAGLVVDMLSPPLKFADSTETSVAFMLESGPEALATGRTVLRMQDALQDPAKNPALLSPTGLANVA